MTLPSLRVCSLLDGLELPSGKMLRLAGRRNKILEKLKSRAGKSEAGILKPGVVF